MINYSYNKLDDSIIKMLNAESSKYGRIQLTLPNTKGISSQMLRSLDSRIQIRVYGSNTDERIKRYKSIYVDSQTDSTKKEEFAKQQDGQFIASSTYSRDELIEILIVIEQIESEIQQEWSDLKKTIYFYETLKQIMFYPPEHVKYMKDYSKYGTLFQGLRSLKSGNGVCAAYAICLKELLDRQGIESIEVIGDATTADPNNPNKAWGGHAWDLVKIDGKYIPIDVTLGACSDFKGVQESGKYFGNVEEFNATHKPYAWDPTVNSGEILYGINSYTVQKLTEDIRKQQTLKNRTVMFQNNDFKITQVGASMIGGKVVYKYLCQSISNPNAQPQLIFSETNLVYAVTAYLTQKAEENPNSADKKTKIVSDAYIRKLQGELFSQATISGTRNKRSKYIGCIDKDANSHEIASSNLGNPNPRSLTINSTEIGVLNVDSEIANNPWFTSDVIRNLGNNQVIYQVSDRMNVNGRQVNAYEIFTILKDGSLRKNTVFSEASILHLIDKNNNGIRDFLRPENLQRACRESHGYIGTLDYLGKAGYDSQMLSYVCGIANVQDRAENRFFSAASTKVELAQKEYMKFLDPKLR